MVGRELEFGIRITSDGQVVIKESGRVVQAINTIGKQAEEVNKRVGRLSSTVGEMGHLAAGIYTLQQAFQGLAHLTRVADAFSSLESRLALVTEGASQLAAVQARLFQIAQDSRVSFTDLGEVYTRLSRSSAETGTSASRMMGVTQTLSRAMTIGGGSAESMRAALMQLGQGLASGALRGEELNSVMEQTPRLAQAIADGMGISIGQLRKMGEAGALTSRAIIEALEKAAPGIEMEFRRMAPTISGAFQALRDAASLFITELDKGVGGSRRMAESMRDLGKSLGEAAREAKRFGEEHQAIVNIAASAVGFSAVTIALGAIIGKVAELRKLVAHPIVITVALAAAAKSALDEFRESETGLRARLGTARSELRSLERNVLGIPDAPDPDQQRRIDAARAAVAELESRVRATEAARAAASPTALAISALRESERAYEKEQEDARRAREGALEKFIASEAVQSKAAKRLADQNELMRAFANSVDGFDSASTQYQRAYTALMQGLLNVDEKYKHKGPAGVDLDAQRRDELERLAKQSEQELAALQKAQEARARLDERLRERLDTIGDRAVKAAGEFGTGLIQRRGDLAERLAELGRTPLDVEALRALRGIDRDFEKAAERITETLGAIGDTEGIDRMVGELQRLAEAAKGEVVEGLDAIDARQEELAASWEFGAGEALRKYAETARDVASQTEHAVTSAFRVMEDALVEFVTKGKLDFRSLAESILADLARIQIREAATKIFGLGKKTEKEGSGGNDLLGDLIVTVMGAHSGAVVGREASFLRAAPAGMFAGAQRYHSGLMPNEFPAILQRGEGVFTPAQMRQLAPAGSQAVTVHQTIQLSAGVAQTVRAEVMGMMPQIQQATVAAVADARSRGGGFAARFGG